MRQSWVCLTRKYRVLFYSFIQFIRKHHENEHILIFKALKNKMTSVSFFPFFDNERKTHLEKTTVSFWPMRSFATRMKWSYKRDIKITGTVLITGNHCALTMCQAQVNHNHFLIYSTQKSWEEGVIILTSYMKKKDNNHQIVSNLSKFTHRASGHSRVQIQICLKFCARNLFTSCLTLKVKLRKLFLAKRWVRFEFFRGKGKSRREQVHISLCVWLGHSAVHPETNTTLWINCTSIIF